MEYAIRAYTTSGRSGIVTKTFDDAIKCIDIYPEQCSKNCQWLTKVVEMRDACDYLGIRWYA